MKRAIIAGTAVFGLVASFSACGGDSAGITDPGKKDTTTVVPLNTNVIVSALLTDITAGQTAISAAASAGGVPTAPPPASYSVGTSLPHASFNRATAPGPTDDAAQCTFEAEAVRFVCPPFTAANGLVTTSYFQLLDAASVPMAKFDTALTVAIRRVTQKTGFVSNPLITQTGPVPAVDTTKNNDDLVLSGIKTTVRRLNGTGTMAVVIVPEGQPVVHITATTTTADLSFTPTPPKYPLTGKVTAVVSSIRGTDPQTTTSQVTTYDGSKIAKLVITLLNGSTRTCTWDMTANVPPVCTTP
jgi:hypothetical protein